MLIFLNVLCIIIIFFIGADIFSLADEISYCKINNIDVLKRRYSTCRECGHRLYIKDTFPVVSRFINKGKCRFCDAEFDKKSFYTEISGGLAAVLVFSLLYYTKIMSIFMAASIMIVIIIAAMLVISFIYVRKKSERQKNPDDKNDILENKEE